MSEICDVFKIIHRKDGVYDLFQDNNWIMSRGCIDNILNFLATTSKYSGSIEQSNSLMLDMVLWKYSRSYRKWKKKKMKECRKEKWL